MCTFKYQITIRNFRFEVSFTHTHVPSDVSPGRVEAEHAHHEDEERPLESVVKDPGEGVGEQDDVDESV